MAADNVSATKPAAMDADALVSCGQAEPKEEEEEEELCAICFESTQMGALSLPCRCTVAYCFRCWDRALAHSIKTCGAARCPTCRMPVRVDFDPEEGRMVFSAYPQAAAAAVDDGDDEGFPTAGSGHQGRPESRQAVIERLAAQALPLQRTLLRRFGEETPALRAFAENAEAELSRMSVAKLKRHIQALEGSADGCVEKNELVRRLLDVAGGARRLAGYLVDSSGVGAKCVCSGTLRRLSGHERFMTQLRGMHGPRVDEIDPAVLAHMRRHNGSGIICDVCEGHCPMSDTFWTCDTADATILHATAYDVCERCFLDNTLGGGGGAGSEA